MISMPQGWGTFMWVFMYRYVQIFGGTYFQKSAELSVSLYEICAELWVPFEDTCKIIGTIWGYIAKLLEANIFHILGYIKLFNALAIYLGMGYFGYWGHASQKHSVPEPYKGPTFQNYSLV